MNSLRFTKLPAECELASELSTDEIAVLIAFDKDIS